MCQSCYLGFERDKQSKQDRSLFLKFSNTNMEFLLAVELELVGFFETCLGSLPKLQTISCSPASKLFYCI
jgi:hypothetical protein